VAINRQPPPGFGKRAISTIPKFAIRALLVTAAFCAALHATPAASTNDLATRPPKRASLKRKPTIIFPAAIEAYQGVINRFDEDRKLAANPPFSVSAKSTANKARPTKRTHNTNASCANFQINPRLRLSANHISRPANRSASQCADHQRRFGIIRFDFRRSRGGHKKSAP